MINPNFQIPKSILPQNSSKRPVRSPLSSSLSQALLFSVGNSLRALKREWHHQAMSPTQRLEILQPPLEVNNKEIVRRQKKLEEEKITGISVSKRKEKSATGKLHVIPPGKMVVVGPKAPDFVIEISMQVQKRAPFNVKKWKKVPDLEKDDIVSRVYNAFDIDQTDHNKAVILATAERLYRSHRGRLHQHFKQYETNEITLKHKPDELSEGDWEYLVDYFSSSGYKVRVEQASMRMLQETYEDAEEDPIINKAFKSVVGERSGYCRGLGAGIQPTKGKSTAGLHEQLVSEREKRQGIEMKLKEVESQFQEERDI
ncbi:uncharacterized protein LOC130709518 isoform X2 [Lotus japonicus]|uniref:uncharacterized protein LOC130709518 isoform X2 n=1 Tax=Lotus japonicus TaxID=34305 RepID=UPI0025839091|nr:uncharacterized protein LOC130709518 isoform X2 [Lotus japonicus]